jgi:hypothetical protein
MDRLVQMRSKSAERMSRAHGESCRVFIIANGAVRVLAEL